MGLGRVSGHSTGNSDCKRKWFMVGFGMVWVCFGFGLMTGLVRLSLEKEVADFFTKIISKKVCTWNVDLSLNVGGVSLGLQHVSQLLTGVYRGIPIRKLITHPLPKPSFFRGAVNQFQILFLSFAVHICTHIVYLKKKLVQIGAVMSRWYHDDTSSNFRWPSWAKGASLEPSQGHTKSFSAFPHFLWTFAGYGAVGTCGLPTREGTSHGVPCKLKRNLISVIPRRANVVPYFGWISCWHLLNSLSEVDIDSSCILPICGTSRLPPFCLQESCLINQTVFTVDFRELHTHGED